MYVIQCCSVFCLLLPVPSGTGIVTKSVCRGDSILLFENILDSRDTAVSLYMNHQTHILMAQWDVQNSTIMSHIQPGYEEKVYLSKDGSIWIHNVIQWDEEKYFIEYGRDTPYVKYEAEIRIKDAPTTHCKPKITHGDKILIASLEDKDCGTPVVSVQWLDHPGISNTSKRVINLPSGNEAGTYYACLKGPALECVKISTLSDYCSSYTIRGDNSPPLSSQPSADISNLKTAVFVMVPFVVCCFLMSAALIAIKICEIQRKCFFSEILNEDQIQKWLNDHPDCMKKALDQNGSRATNPPTLEELAVTSKEVDNETEDNQSLLVSPQGKIISPKICGDSSSGITDPHFLLLLAAHENNSEGTDPDLPRGADRHSARLPPPDMNISGETTPLLSENQASDSASNKLSVEINPQLPREDAHFLPISLPTPMNIPGSEAGFRTTAQGKNKIHTRETNF